MATTTVLRQRQPSVQESLLPEQLREWAIWWASPGGGAGRARAGGAAWGATTRGTYESTPTGSAAGRRGGSGGGQQQQQRPLQTLSPQQLREWAVQWGSPGGGGFRGTRTWGVEAPGGVEAASLGAFDSASAGAEPEDALHTFTLDSGASRCFFRDSTTVTPLIARVPVTLADPSGSPVVVRGATVLPCLAAPSDILTGLHLPLFAKNLVATSVLQDQWVTITQLGEELVAICTDSRTDEHLATFTRRPGSGLYTLTNESVLVAESGQVAASVEVTASCSCRLLMHQTLLWHHRLGHPSLQRLRGMHSRLLRTAPHSSSFPPTTAPLQTLHMDVWGPARVTGQGGERYFLLVVEDYTRYTTVFPLQGKVEVRSVLIRWIRAVRLELSARFRQDLPVLRLHSDRGGEFSSCLLKDFCGVKGIHQSFTLLASPQHNGIAERRIGLVMEVACTSMIHAATPHFLWPFVVQYAAQLNLWPRVSVPEISPTLRWMGEVGDVSEFRVWGSPSLVRHLLASKLSPHTLHLLLPSSPPPQFPCASPAALLGCRPPPPPPPVAPLPPPGPAPSGVSQVDPPPLVEPLEVCSDTSGPAEGGDPTAADTVAPRRSARSVVPPGFPPRPSSPPLQPVVADSGAAGGGDTGGAAGGAAVGGVGGVGAGGSGARRQETLSPEWLCEWAVRWGSPGGGAGHAGAGSPGGTGPGGAIAGIPGVGRAGGTGAGGTGATGGARGPGGVGAVAGGTGSSRQEPLSPERLQDWAVQWGCPGGGARSTGAGGTGPGGGSAGVHGVGGTGGADTGGATGGTGVGGASRQESLSPQQLHEWAVRWGTPGGGAGGIGSGGAVATGVEGSGGATTQPQPSALRHILSLPPAATEFHVAGTTPPLLFPPPDQSQPQLLPHNPLRAPAPYTAVTESLTEIRELASRPITPVRTRRVARSRPPTVPGTHTMALRPSSVPHRVVLLSPPASSLPHVPDLESDHVRAISPTVTHPLAMVVTAPSFESTAAYDLVTELVDFAALCRLDYAASLVFDSSCPPSVRGELALDCDVLEDRHFELECLVATAPHLASTLLCLEGDPDALDIPTPRSYADVIMGPQREGVDFFQTFSPTPKMTTLSVLLHVATQRDYELHSLDFFKAFLQGSLHEAIWLRRPSGFTGSFPEGTQTTLAALGFAPSTANPSLFLRTDTSLPPFYVLVYVDDLVSATSDTEALALVLQRFGFEFSSRQPTPLPTGHSLSAPPSDEFVELSGPYPKLVGCLMYLMTCTRPDLAYPLSRLARYVAPGRHQKVHWEAEKRVLHYLCSTSSMGLVFGRQGSVVLTSHSDASWVDDQTTHRSTESYSFSLSSGSVSWRSTRSSSVLSSSCEAEIYTGATATQELRWVTYLLTDSGEQPRSPPVLYVDNKAMFALC
ncbi:unnamed protein product [Closterium sp. NIES-54]